jgi:hypothetical protein
MRPLPAQLLGEVMKLPVDRRVQGAVERIPVGRGLYREGGGKRCLARALEGQAESPNRVV